MTFRIRPTGAAARPPADTFHAPAPACARRALFAAGVAPAIGAALAIAAGTAAAQTSAAIPAVIVTASRTPLAPEQVLADTVVIDQARIDRAAGQSLAELLQQAAGVEIAANGGPGQPSSLFLRGSNANHVVVLVDGVRMGSATAGTTALESLPLAQVERIEVLRGPASSLYGADAIGGVIQVFTRQHDRVQARLGLGSQHTTEAGAGFGRAFGDWRVSLQAGFLETRAFSATRASNVGSYDPDRDPHRNRSLNLALTRSFAPGHSLVLRGLRTDGTTHYDDFGGGDARSRQRLGHFALESRNQLGDGWRSLLRLARGEDRRADVAGSSFHFDTRQDQATWQHDVDVAGGTLAAGLDWRRDAVESSTAFDRDRRRVLAGFASYAGRFDAHLLQASLRHDDDSQFGGRSTGKLAYGWQFAPAWRLSASAGTAFKAPTFNDLYFPGFSNPDLRPETSRSVEGTLRYEADGVDAGATLFQNRIRDLIQFDAATSRPENIADARIRGLTLGGGWRADPWSLRAEWTHQQAEDVGRGQRLPRRAADHGTLSLDVAPEPWQAGIALVASGERYDTSFFGPRPRLGGYLLVNLHARWQFSPQWSALVRLDNATDRDVELVSGYQSAGRRVFAAVEFSGQ